MSKTLECLPFYYKVHNNVKRRKPKAASLERNNNKKPTDITVFIAQHLENSKVLLTPYRMILAFLKWYSEALLQNRFISVDKASRKCDCVLNHTDRVEKYKIYVFKHC